MGRESERGPPAHGRADQRWTPSRVKSVVDRLFHLSYTVEGMWLPLRHYGWSWQQPTRRSMERDDHAVEP
ncbi:winged helix-turn-helix domain-containing protein [uncultured Streptomyces sp.]|uniref:helix-turn-helix domain-containing protein n=1 Tax=uncultured Streptomyces sp. TaxID=174707 RepID=UPI002612B9B3|nr:winged helix-turn-helix domain-containing protein [uncultured Streptomyces sp.]